MLSQKLLCSSTEQGFLDFFLFDNEYKTMAEVLNILLAPCDDPDNSFTRSQEGCVCSINYNTVNQTWWLCEGLQGFIY